MKKTALICLLGLMLVSGIHISDAFAFKVARTQSGRVIKWRNAVENYYVNAKGGPTGSVPAIRNAAAAWTNVASTSFYFTYKGTTTSTRHGTLDRVNLVSFGAISDPGTLAVNEYWYNPTTGEMLDSDLRFNTRYAWSTTGAIAKYDLQNVATHELGHSLSLNDLYGIYDKQKTMYGYCAKRETKKRTLDPDDVNGITYIYPY